jgi:amyloid beta precursor protein binding protein 1
MRSGSDSPVVYSCYVHGCGSVGFLHAVGWDSLGQSKAKTVSAFLHELNDAVGAKFVEELPEALLESNPAFFSQFTLVIATQVKLQMSVVLRVLFFCI